MPRIILEGFCKQECIFTNLPDGRQVNETEQKYQNLHQLLPRPVVIYMVVMVHLPGNKTPARSCQCMAAYPGIISQCYALEPGGSDNVDVCKLVY